MGDYNCKYLRVSLHASTLGHEFRALVSILIWRERRSVHHAKETRVNEDVLSIAMDSITVSDLRRGHDWIASST
jgi:hypothetical protein